MASVINSQWFKLDIECDNDAFVDMVELEVSSILRRIADGIEKNGLFANSAIWITDSNGNRVGTYKFERR